MNPRYMLVRLPDEFPDIGDPDLLMQACQFVAMNVAAISTAGGGGGKDEMDECDVGLMIVRPDTQDHCSLYDAVHAALGADPTPENGWYEGRIECGVGGWQ